MDVHVPGVLSVKRESQGRTQMQAGMEITCCTKRYIHGLVYILTIGLEVSDNSATAGDCSDIYERPGNKGQC